MCPTTRTAPRSVPATGPRSWPHYATSSSPRYAWPGSPTSPPRYATTPETRTSTHYLQDHMTTLPGPCIQVPPSSPQLCPSVAQRIGEHGQRSGGHGHPRGGGQHVKLLVRRVDLVNRPSPRSRTHPWWCHAGHLRTRSTRLAKSHCVTEARRSLQRNSRVLAHSSRG
jgi:hypothetical protein